MNRRIIRNIVTLTVLIAVAVLGTIVTSWNFMQIYATSRLAWWAAVPAAAGGAFICVGLGLMGRVGNVVKTAILAGVAALAFFKADVIVGGFAYIFNFMIESINNYYNGGIYYIYLTEKMLRNGNQPLFMLIACALSGWGYMSVLLNHRGTFFAVLSAVFSYLLPATLENVPPLPVLCGVLCFMVCCIILGALPRERDGLRPRTAGVFAMLWVTLPALVLMFGVTRLVTEADYRAPLIYDDVAGRLVFSLQDIKQVLVDHGVETGQQDTKNDAGAIGSVDSVSYTDTPIMLVEAPKEGGTLYLKTFQAAQYTKRRWKELPSSVYTGYAGMFEELYADGLTPVLAANRAVEALMDMGAVGIGSAAYDISVLQYECRGNSYIPVSAVQIDAIPVEDLMEKDMNIRLPEDTEGAQNVRHEYSIYEWRNFSSLDKLIVDGDVLLDDEDNRYRDFVYRYYLDDNTSCAGRIKRELLPDIKSGDYEIGDVSGRARFILDTIAYLGSGGYEYTLSPGVTPASKDYVEYFLFEEKRGLCTHFASAAVMIFRCAGIPARYVEGFVVPESLYGGDPVYKEDVVVGSDGKYGRESWHYYKAIVTDRYAHAWVEVYIDGIGWITVDPTPGYASAYMNAQNRYNENGGTDIADAEDKIPHDTTGDEETAAIDEQDSTANEPDSRTTVDGMATENSYDETAGAVMSSERNPDMVQGTDDARSDGSHGSVKPGDGTGEIQGDGSGEGVYDEDNTGGGFDIAAVARALSNIFVPVLHVLLIIIRIIALPAVIVLFLVIRQKYMEQKRVRLYNKACGFDTDERIRRIMSCYERMVKHTDADTALNMDITEIIDGMPVEGMDMTAVKSAVGRALFSNGRTKEDETMLVMAYVAAVRERIYSDKNILKKLYYKYILAI